MIKVVMGRSVFLSLALMGSSFVDAMDSTKRDALIVCGAGFAAGFAGVVCGKWLTDTLYRPSYEERSLVATHDSEKFDALTKRVSALESVTEQVALEHVKHKTLLEHYGSEYEFLKISKESLNKQLKSFQGRFFLLNRHVYNISAAADRKLYPQELLKSLLPRGGYGNHPDEVPGEKSPIEPEETKQNDATCSPDDPNTEEPIFDDEEEH